MDTNSNIMSQEEEDEMEAMVRQRRSRAMAFYGRDPPTNREEDGPPEVHLGSSSGLILPNVAPMLGDQKVLSPSSRLVVGYADTIGRRPTMEDEIVIFGKLRGNDDEDLIGVFDGHGGRDVSEFSAKYIPKILQKKLDELNDPEQSLIQTFKEVNAMIKDQNVSGGTTAIVAFFQKSKCYIANAGDSRAVLCQADQAIRLSKDHKPDDPEEEERITKAGGTVTKMNNIKLGKVIARVNGMLAVSRALGDIFLQPFVSCEPEVRQIEVSSPSNQLLILACDGLWDVVSDEEAIAIAMAEDDPEQASIKLRETALSKSSTDNISVVVVRLPPSNPIPFSRPLPSPLSVPPKKDILKGWMSIVAVIGVCSLLAGFSYYWK